MENSKNTGKMIGALVLGAAIGGSLGLLFAPDKGSETRKKIAQKGGDLTDSAKEKFMCLIEDIKNEISWGKKKTRDMVENGVTNVDQG